jgi:hypothetical protein
LNKSTFLILLFSPYLIAKASFDSLIYYPQQYVKKKICYEVYSPEVNLLLKEKLVYDRNEKLIAQTCIGKIAAKTRFKYEFLNVSNLLNDVLTIYNSKSQFVTPITMKDFLKGYELKKERDFWSAKSIDTVSANEILIYQKKKKPIRKMIIKRPVGTTVLNLFWKKFRWSKRKYVLVKMVVDRREGIQNVSSVFKINYHNFLKLGLPSKVEIYTGQNIGSGVGGNRQTRKSKNIYYFENYKFL